MALALGISNLDGHNGHMAIKREYSERQASRSQSYQYRYSMSFSEVPTTVTILNPALSEDTLNMAF
jgi:hypothetical protein